MNMYIFFKISAEGMDGKIDTREKPFPFCPIFDDGCGDKGNTVDKIPIQPKEVPEFIRHGKSMCCQVVVGRVLKLFLIQMSVAFLPQDGQNLDLQL